MSVLKDKILQADDLEKKQVYISQWDATVEVRSLTGKQRASIIKSVMSPDGKIEFIDKMYGDLLIECCYDPETGELLFSEADKDALNNKNGSALENIARIAMDLSGLSEQVAQDMEKN
jgi:hypothetical protein